MSPERIVTPRYCQLCGRYLVERYVPQEGRTRYVCEGCGFVHYVNPRVVTSVIVERDGRLLLQQRAIDPRRGYWTFPGGFLEVGETTQEGAMRETKEETGIDVTLSGLVGVYTRPRVGIVLVVYQGQSDAGDAFPADAESSVVQWFAVEEIPWRELAFETTQAALRDWVAARAS